MRHPLWGEEVEFEEEIARANPPVHVVGKLRQFRANKNPSDIERQEAMALWHSTVPQPKGFRWPWKTLDRATGLLPAGDLAVVLAQTGSGKTTFTASLLNRLSNHTNALVFATEIPSERYLSQLASRRAGLHPDRVELGEWSTAGWRMSPEDARQAHRIASAELVRWGNIKVAPHLRLKSSQLRDTLRKEADTHCPEVVVIDHFQAIQHDLYEGVSAVQATLEVIQDFAVREYVTVVVTNQVHVRGQAGMPPRPTDCVHLAGVFGGQALGQAATQILGVHRRMVDLTRNGTAVTPDFLREYRKAGGNESELWDRTSVAIDLPKLRYDANGTSGSEVVLKYANGLYFDPDDA